ERRFSLAAKPGERGSQIVCDIVERIPHAANQCLEPCEELVEERCHFSQGIAGLLHRYTSADVTGPQDSLDGQRKRSERRQSRVGENGTASRGREQDAGKKQQCPCAKPVERTTPAGTAFPNLYARPVRQVQA